MTLGINAVFAAASGPLRLDPYLAHNFLVEVDSLLVGGFSRVTGLSSSVEVHDHVEGGENAYVHKLAGATRHPNLVLSRGVTALDTLWSWYDDVTRGTIQRRDITLMMLDRERIPVMWWTIRAALPVKWEGPTFDASAEAAIAVETVELVHRGIEKPPFSRGVAATRALAGLVGR